MDSIRILEIRWRSEAASGNIGGWWFASGRLMCDQQVVGRARSCMGRAAWTVR